MGKQVHVLLFILLAGCSTSKQGKVIQGKEGKIESAVITAKCTQPQKSYARDVETKIKAEMDSLKFTPEASFEVVFNQKVVKLREYTQQGLDLDLLTFRICEMANNRGMTAEQTSALIEKAIQIWSSKSQTGFYQDIRSYNQQGGITAGVIVVPENQEVPLNDNFSITEKDNLGKIVYELKPRQGTWNLPFIAYPAEEDSTVKGYMSQNTGVMMGSRGDGEILVSNGNKYKVVYQTSQTPANPDFGFLFIYMKKPTVLFFGDFSNPKKQYSLALK